MRLVLFLTCTKITMCIWTQINSKPLLRFQFFITIVSLNFRLFCLLCTSYLYQRFCGIHYFCCLHSEEYIHKHRSGFSLGTFIEKNSISTNNHLLKIIIIIIIIIIIVIIDIVIIIVVIIIIIIIIIIIFMYIIVSMIYMKKLLSSDWLR